MPTILSFIFIGCGREGRLVPTRDRRVSLIMDNHDPIATFFPGEEDVDLYAVLSLGRDAKAEEIRKAYHRLALVYHPDKHASAAQGAKDDASRKFQQIGFAYAVLSDEKRRPRYDRTGR